MAIDISLKQTGFFKKKLTISDIENTLNEYAYGVFDEDFVLDDLEEDFNDKSLIFYDLEKIGRGFSLEYVSSQKAINLCLNVPCTYHDVNIFYECAQRLANLMGIQEIEQDGEPLTLAEIPQMKDYILDWVGDIFNSCIEEDKLTHIFGAIYPIHLEDSFIAEIKGASIPKKLSAFEEYLHGKQSQDLYYASSQLFQKEDGSLFGSFSLFEEIETIFPIEPALPVMSEDLEVQAWYIDIVSVNEEDANLEGHIIFVTLKKLFDLEKLVRFDESHCIITLQSADIEKLRPYFVEL